MQFVLLNIHQPKEKPMIISRRVCNFCGWFTDQHFMFCPHGENLNSPKMILWQKGYNEAFKGIDPACLDNPYYLCGWNRGDFLHFGPR
jgi:hypothetical protein